jgi:hypothetical protein
MGLLGEGVSVVAGELEIVVQNRGLHACALSGYPVVTFLNASRVLGFSYQHTPPGPFNITTAPPHRVSLRPGASAYVEMAKEACMSSGTRATVLQLRMPGTKGTLTLSLLAAEPGQWWGYCEAIGNQRVGDQIDTTPAEPSVRKLFSSVNL